MSLLHEVPGISPPSIQCSKYQKTLCKICKVSETPLKLFRVGGVSARTETESVKYSFKWSENEPLSTVTDGKEGAHTHICVRELAKVCSEVLSKRCSVRFLLPWSTHQGCLMALEIRAACLFVSLRETALHQTEDLFVFIMAARARTRASRVSGTKVASRGVGGLILQRCYSVARCTEV